MEEPAEETVEEAIEEPQEEKEDANISTINNIDIRVNNCFVNAKKEYLNEVKKKWDDFIAYETNANKKLLSYIMDTEIVAMSDSYGILKNALESTVDLINENISSLEKDFKLFYGNDCKFVALTDKKWDKTKKEYTHDR